MKKDKVSSLIKKEEKRQKKVINLIPSENYVSQAVLKALGSVFTNKYSEGYPGSRYYSGQGNMDDAENLTISLACKIFKCKYANVQPLSGAMANWAVYFGLLKPGDKILAMDLSHGGHLTHGHSSTHISKIFKFIFYITDEKTGKIDFKKLEKTALKEKPKMILAGFSSYTRNLDWKKFAGLAREAGAISVADISHIAGLVAGGVLENPFNAGFDVITTTTHKTLRGPRGGMILIRDNKLLAEKINKSVFPGLQGGPHMNNILAKAVCFEEVLSPSFKKYARQILKNTKAMEKVFRQNNVEMVFGGTDNHMILIDTTKNFGISGEEAQGILEKSGINVNKNVIPNDTRKPADPSGIRIGTPAVTTRGFKEKDCERTARKIITLLVSRRETSKSTKIEL